MAPKQSEPHSQAANGSSHDRHERLGKALSELLENPLVSGAIGRALGAREKAAVAQELWMAALNLPSAADLERLTRRVRSVSQRLEGVEDGVGRLGQAVVGAGRLEQRLAGIEERLEGVEQALARVADQLEAKATARPRRPAARGGAASRGAR